MNERPTAPMDQPNSETLAAALPASIAILVERSIAGASSVRVADVRTMFGGNARKAWSFTLTYQQGGIARTIPCVMLAQVGGRQIESDVDREFHVLSMLNDKGLRIPRAVCMDPHGAIIGHPSIVLERLEGETDAVKLLRRVSRDSAVNTIADLARVVAGLHKVAPDIAAFEPELAGQTPEAIARAQLTHWRRQFETNRMEPLPVLAGIFNWLDDHLPAPQRIALVHGDLRPGNFLYRDGAVTGLLDWEMAHLGDPVEDIGWIYRPLWSPERLVPLDDFLDLYKAATGIRIPPHHMTYWRVFSEAKFATISVSASHAYAAGNTHNIRHADRQSKVAPCLWRCLDDMALFEAQAHHD